jgi:hypothetical protein
MTKHGGLRAVNVIYDDNTPEVSSMHDHEPCTPSKHENYVRALKRTNDAKRMVDDLSDQLTALSKDLRAAVKIYNRATDLEETMRVAYRNEVLGIKPPAMDQGVDNGYSTGEQSSPENAVSVSAPIRPGGDVWPHDDGTRPSVNPKP